MKKFAYTAEIIEIKKETPGLRLLHLEKPPAFSHIPGQYIQIGIPEENDSDFFALASHPDDRFLELLINAGNGKICEKPVGSYLNISSPSGPGFPIHLFFGKTVYLVTHGSGISSIKPLIEEMRKNRHRFGQIRLIYGVRTPEDFAYKNLLRNWMGSVEVYDIISRDPDDLKIWSGETGHVQQILEKLQPVPDNAIVAVSGSPAMENEIIQIFQRFSYEKNQILQNHFNTP